MRKVRKTAAVLLALVLLLGLAGCGGSFESKVIKGVNEMQQLKNLHADVCADIDIEMEIFKQSLDMNTKFELSSDVQIEPFKAYSVISSDLMGIKEEVYSYIEKDGDTYLSLSSEDGDEWDEDSFSSDGEGGIGDINLLGVLSILAKYASSFQEAGEEKVLNFETLRYDGSITSDDIHELLDVLGGQEILEQAMDDEMNMDDIMAGIKGPFTIPTSIWIDGDSGMIVKYRMDISEMMAGIMPLMMDELVDDMDMNITGMGVDLNIGKMILEVILSQFDEVGEIQRPDAA